MVVDEEGVRKVDCGELVDDLMLDNKPIVLSFNLASLPHPVHQPVVLHSNDLHLSAFLLIASYIYELIDALNLAVLQDEMKPVLSRGSLGYELVV
jgi:hypothetical protein